LWEGLQNAGLRSARSAAFFCGEKKVAAHLLPEAAWCVSRFVLDEWLAREFQRLGGELRLGARWSGEFGKGMVRASGRRGKAVTDGWRLFGLKVHARQVALEADLEMHFVPSGYVGLCQLGGGEVNICGLFRSQTTVPDLARGWREWLGGPAGSALRSRVAGAQFEEDSFCSAAGLCLHPQGAAQRAECCVGDALTLIAPVTGNGMSMAFESAELALEPLVKFSRGDRSWAEARDEIAGRCDRMFTPRLRSAAWLQRALFRPTARWVLLFLAARSKWFWRRIFERTR
jgi:2-polyprenyl-6-methoxyphenol hydroxylase-like FAD-dependent oxidoreductase